MKIFITNCVWLLLLFIVGCATIRKEKWRDIDRRIVELSQTTQTLEKKIDGLSRSISLLISDGNEVHNELEDTKNRCKDNRQKIEDIETSIKNLDDHIETLETDHKAAEEKINKRIDDIEKAEIELSNRLELMKLDMKEHGKDKTVPPSLP